MTAVNNYKVFGFIPLGVIIGVGAVYIGGPGPPPDPPLAVPPEPQAPASSANAEAVAPSTRNVEIVGRMVRSFLLGHAAPLNRRAVSL